MDKGLRYLKLSLMGIIILIAPILYMCNPDSDKEKVEKLKRANDSLWIELKICQGLKNIKQTNNEKPLGSGPSYAGPQINVTPPNNAPQINFPDQIKIMVIDGNNSTRETSSTTSNSINNLGYNDSEVLQLLYENKEFLDLIKGIQKELKRQAKPLEFFESANRLASIQTLIQSFDSLKNFEDKQKEVESLIANKDARAVKFGKK